MEVSSHTSIMCLRTKYGLHIGCDSQGCEGDWSLALDHDLKKAFLISDINIMAAFTGSANLQIQICKKLDDDFPDGMPSTWPFYRKVKSFFRLAKDCILNYAPKFKEDLNIDSEAAFKALKSSILVGGYDNIQDKFRIFKLTIAKDCEIEEYDDATNVVLLGSGTPYMDQKRYLDHLAGSFKPEEGIAYVINCLDHAATNEWGTGGTLHVYTIEPSVTYHDSWPPNDRGNSGAGYGPPSRDDITSYTKCGEVYREARTSSTPTSTPWS